MSWTAPKEVIRQAERLWERGVLPGALLRGEPLFPWRLKLKKPNSAELVERFDEVHRWIETLRRGEEQGYRILWREVNHPVLGRSRIPQELWIDEASQALEMIGRASEAARFLELGKATLREFPRLEEWLFSHPRKVLGHLEEWSRFLLFLRWMREHPRPGIYLRQVDLPGVDSKFLERHRGILRELLEVLLSPEALEKAPGGMRGFCGRFGFREKPCMVRFRPLDPSLAPLPGGGEQDLTVPASLFGAWKSPLPERVFITENEINYLCFPPKEGSMVLFGGGYGFEALEGAGWLRDRPVYYWGDLDTHGFSILHQLRGVLPRALSLLMDRETLLAHREYWGEEPKQEVRELSRLTPEEGELYRELCSHRYAPRLRLEQERIRFGAVRRAVGALGTG